MKNNKQTLEIKRKIIKVLKNRKIKRAGIFGSFARGDNHRGSDIDILIEPPEKTGLGFVPIQIELEKALKKKVDLLSYRAINPKLKERILSEEIRII